MTITPSPNLFPNYAPLGRMRRWKRRIKSAIFYLFGLGIIVLMVKFGPRIVAQAEMQISQVRCAHFVVTPDTWVYVEDFPTATQILRDASYVRLASIPEATTRVIRQPPSSWANFAHYIPPVYDMNFKLAPVDQCTVLLFMHNRVSTTGKERLVVVGLDLPKDPHPEYGRYSRFSVVCHVIRLGIWSSPPCVESGRIYGQRPGFQSGDDSVDTLGEDGKLQFLAGQSDTSDPARFIIPWEFKGVRHTIRGVLEESEVDQEWSLHLTLTGLP